MEVTTFIKLKPVWIFQTAAQQAPDSTCSPAEHQRVARISELGYRGFAGWAINARGAPVGYYRSGVFLGVGEQPLVV